MNSYPEIHQHLHDMVQQSLIFLGITFQPSQLQILTISNPLHSHKGPLYTPVALQVQVQTKSAMELCKEICGHIKELYRQRKENGDPVIEGLSFDVQPPGFINFRIPCLLSELQSSSQSESKSKEHFISSYPSNNSQIEKQISASNLVVSSTSLKLLGAVQTCFPEKFGTPRQGSLVKHSRGRLYLSPTIPIDALEGLEGFSHAWIIFLFHENTPSLKFKAKIRPPKLQMIGSAKRGVFSTRSPHRLNDIGLSLVRIGRLREQYLELEELDLVSGTPVLDLKPHHPQDIPRGVYKSPKWVRENPMSVKFSETALSELRRIIPKLVFYDSFEEALGLIEGVLAADPRTQHSIGKGHSLLGVSLDRMDISFRVTDSLIYVVQIVLCAEEGKRKPLRNQAWFENQKALFPEIPISVSEPECKEVQQPAIENYFLSPKDAQELDIKLVEEYFYSIPQLMELAGLTVAEICEQEFPSRSKILVVCGPGNNGGDGLVAARHFSHFGYSVHVVYPKRSQRYASLVSQLSALQVTISDTLNVPMTGFSFIVDAIFGFSFSPQSGIRSPFDTLITALGNTNVPIISIDIPSGWDVIHGDVLDTKIVPHVLISLTAPKPCTQHFKGIHYLGGRFLPPSLAAHYKLKLPEFPGHRSFVRL